MLDLYFRAELASSRRDPKEKWGEIRRQKINGDESHFVYIGHTPHARGIDQWMLAATLARLLKDQL